MSSFGESKARTLLDESGPDFVRYNMSQLSRVYPGASRQDSSNLDPSQPWTGGCQIGESYYQVTIIIIITIIIKLFLSVALNYQTDDTQNLLNRAMFRGNGGCGYRLKPRYLRSVTTRIFKTLTKCRPLQGARPQLQSHGRWCGGSGELRLPRPPSEGGGPVWPEPPTAGQ